MTYSLRSGAVLSGLCVTTSNNLIKTALIYIPTGQPKVDNYSIEREIELTIKSNNKSNFSFLYTFSDNPFGFIHFYPEKEESFTFVKSEMTWIIVPKDFLKNLSYF